MGIVFGSTGSKEPSFTIDRKTADYEIRKYPKYIVADYPMESSNKPDANSGFRELAKYIGVFGDPANAAAQPMAMTAPVITTGAGAGPTVDPAAARRCMSFVMPFELSLAEVPDPTNPDIKVREVPAKTVAVVQFSGWYSDSKGESYARELTRALVDDKLITPEQADSWMVAQYHPPFTIPFLRRNEIWVPIE